MNQLKTLEIIETANLSQSRIERFAYMQREIDTEYNTLRDADQ